MAETNCVERYLSQSPFGVVIESKIRVPTKIADRFHRSQSPFGVVIESKSSPKATARPKPETRSQSPFGVVIESKQKLRKQLPARRQLSRNRLSALSSKASAARYFALRRGRSASQSPFGVVIESKFREAGREAMRVLKESQSPFGVVIESKLLYPQIYVCGSGASRNRLSALSSKASFTTG